MIGVLTRRRVCLLPPPERRVKACQRSLSFLASLVSVGPCCRSACRFWDYNTHPTKLRAEDTVLTIKKWKNKIPFRRTTKLDSLWDPKQWPWSVISNQELNRAQHKTNKQKHVFSLWHESFLSCARTVATNFSRPPSLVWTKKNLPPCYTLRFHMVPHFAPRNPESFAQCRSGTWAEGVGTHICGKMSRKNEK